MSETLLVTHHENWTELTLNRPDQLNCFNREMLVALRGALAAARDTGVGAVLLSGAGRGFCSGQDLREGLAAPDGKPEDLGDIVRTYYNPVVRLMRDAPFPIVCAVNGIAAGAGANMALACDIVLAARGASFVQAFARIGLVPDVGGTWFLTRHLGPARAKALALTAEPVDAATAAEWGLIWKTIPDTQLMDTARALTRQLAHGPTLALGLTKQAIHAASANTLNEQLQLEAQYQSQCGKSDDFVEGIKAFLQKRMPRFQ